MVLVKDFLRMVYIKVVGAKEESARCHFCGI